MRIRMNHLILEEILSVLKKQNRIILARDRRQERRNAAGHRAYMKSQRLHARASRAHYRAVAPKKRKVKK